MRLAALSTLLIVFGSAAPIRQTGVARPAPGATQSRQGAVVKKITARQLGGLISRMSPVTIIDVRIPKHYDSSQTKIVGAIRIPPGDFGWRLSEIPRGKPVVLYCACPDEATSLLLAGRLKEYGYGDVSVLKGGWDAWVQSGGRQDPK